MANSKPRIIYTDVDGKQYTLDDLAAVMDLSRNQVLRYRSQGRLAQIFDMKVRQGTPKYYNPRYIYNWTEVYTDAEGKRYTVPDLMAALGLGKESIKEKLKKGTLDHYFRMRVYEGRGRGSGSSRRVLYTGRDGVDYTPQSLREALGVTRQQMYYQLSHLDKTEFDKYFEWKVKGVAYIPARKIVYTDDEGLDYSIITLARKTGTPPEHVRHYLKKYDQNQFKAWARNLLKQEKKSR